MNRGTTENFDSPLDEVLEGLPQEQPPADLKGRCIAALDEAEKARARLRSLPWGAALRNVAAVAAGLLLVASVGSFVADRHQRARSASSASDVKALETVEAFTEPAPSPGAEDEIAEAPRQVPSAGVPLSSYSHVAPDARSADGSAGDATAETEAALPQASAAPAEGPRAVGAPQEIAGETVTRLASDREARAWTSYGGPSEGMGGVHNFALDHAAARPRASAAPEPSGTGDEAVVWGGPEAGVGGGTNNPRLFRRRQPAEAPAVAGRVTDGEGAYGGPSRRMGGVYQEREGERGGRVVLDDMYAARPPGTEVATSAMTPEIDASAGIRTSRPGETYSTSRQTTAGEPWRDESGERKVIAHKEMEMEVAHVEDAYEDARSLITKHGGYVASDTLRIGVDGNDRVQMTARIPIHEFEDALTDLRRLGKVVRLVGSSQDMTYEYYTEGSKVRELADKEAALIEKLEQEKDRAKKQSLKHQLNILRQQMHSKKTFLEQLSEQVHWPVLDLTIVEKAGPGQFLGQALDNVAQVGGWLVATAIFWVPLVVIVTLAWRRRRPGNSA